MINFFIKTFGCMANTADSNNIVRFLESIGCSKTLDIGTAELIIINTCAIRDKAEQKLFSYLGELSIYKKQKSFLRIGVIGCVASYKKEEIYNRFDHISFVYGARDENSFLFSYLFKTILYLESIKKGESNFKFHGQDRDIKTIVSKYKKDSLNLIEKISFKKNNVSKDNVIHLKEIKKSFINIMTGCNNYCTYCIVPFVRGREKSFSMNMLIDQVKKDILNGVTEINLTGQNVNSYLCPETKKDFPELLRKVTELKGIFWVRWMSPHPQDMTKELFDVIADNQEKIPPYIHFPVQSGSNRILRLMGRNYEIEEYLEQIDWIRTRIKNAVISTDFIVGFPGETEKDFNETIDLIKKVQYDFSYSFIYSPRRYTKAWNMNDNCSAQEKLKRLMELQSLQKKIAAEINKKYLGKKIKTLVEKRLANGKLLSRTEGNLRVFFDGDNSLIGNFVNLMVNKSGPANLEAVYLTDDVKQIEAA